MRIFVLAGALALAGCTTTKLQFESTDPGTTVSVGQQSCVAPCTLEVDASQAVGVKVSLPAIAAAPPPVIRAPKPKPRRVVRPPVTADPNVWPKPEPQVQQ